MRTGLSDLYAGAVEAALGQDPERAAKLYIHARDVIQPERQAAVERKIDRAREERRVTEIVGGLADTPDDPARRPDLDDYQARAVEATPPDASTEVRAQVSRMARIEQARADRAWQAARGRAATGALDWLGANPGAPLMAMPVELRDGLSPEQMQALDRTAMNGGRVVTDRGVYDRLDDQAVRDPESFAAIDLTQHRLSLGDNDYNRLTKLQQALVEGKSDPAFERHRLGRLFLVEALRNANVDLEGEEARAARQKFDRLSGAFEAVEGRPPTMADIRSLVSDVVGGVLPRVNGDPNIVRTSGGEPTEANGNTEIAPPQEPDNTPQKVAAPTDTEIDERSTLSAPVDSQIVEHNNEVISGSFAGDPNIVLTSGGRPPSRRGGGPPLTPFEQMRAANFRTTLENIRQLEPTNRELSYIAPPGWIPRERDVARVQEELAQVRQRAAISRDKPANSSESKAGSEAFHYTRESIRTLIEDSGLRPGSYATTTGTLSPLQAQIDLALPPNRGVPGVIFRLDLNAMRAAGLKIPTPTPVGRSYNMPGGGYEMQFLYPIKPEFITVIK